MRGLRGKGPQRDVLACNGGRGTWKAQVEILSVRHACTTALQEPVSETRSWRQGELPGAKQGPVPGLDPRMGEGQRPRGEDCSGEHQEEEGMCGLRPGVAERGSQALIQ